MIFNKLQIKTIINHKDIVYKTGYLTTDDALFGYILNDISSFQRIKYGVFFNYTWKYTSDLYINDVNDITNEMLYVSYRYLTLANNHANTLYEYNVREEVEFNLCREIDKFFREHPYDIKNPSLHLQ